MQRNFKLHGYYLNIKNCECNSFLIFLLLMMLSNPIYGGSKFLTPQKNAGIGKEGKVDPTKNVTPKKNADTKKDGKEGPPNLGNFALRPSQQPGPLLGFGQRMIEKNQTQLYVFQDAFVGRKRHFIDLLPGVLYQATDKLSVYLNVPYAAEYEEYRHISAGIGDIYCQLEYAYHSRTTNDYNEQATVVGYAAVPSGNRHKMPPTGLGSSSYFIGGTLSRMYVDWHLFTAYGALFPLKKQGEKFGNIYYYQFGVGRNICSVVSKYIFNWLVEINGAYAENNLLNHLSDPDSGGNIIYVTPSLWLSNNDIILQLGVGYPFAQLLHGNQNRSYYLITTNIGWTF